MLTLDRGTFDQANRDAPDWARSVRARGLEVFEQLDMPSSTEEVWRYVELDFDLADFGLPEAPGDRLALDAPARDALGDLAGMAVVVDGFTVEAEHDAGEDVTFVPLSRAGDSAALEARFGMGVAPELDRFAAAHHAFSTDGLFLHVPRNRTVGRPFYVEVHATLPGALTLPHLTIAVDEGAEASVIVNYRSPGAVRNLVVPQVEVTAGDGARFRLTSLQEWGYDTTAIAQQRMVAGRDTSVAFGEVGLGAAMSRLHLVTDLAGQGSRADISGVYFGERTQVLDYRYFMNHAAPNTSSDMFLKGAVEDDAQSVFTGLIRIEEEAQKTNAFQTNRNLVLSDGALANSVPNLEILANDVRCGHGSTMGPLDEEQRYYLQSRGLERVAADRLQVRGFFEEAIRKLPEQSLAGPVRDRVNAKYVSAQEEGRV